MVMSVDASGRARRRYVDMMAIPILVVFAFGFYYMLFGWFSVSDALLLPFVLVSISASITLTAVLMLSIHRRGYRGPRGEEIKLFNLDMKNKPMHRVRAAPILLIGVMLFVVPFTVFGLPGVAHQFIGHRQTYTLLVEDKDHSRKQPRCIRVSDIGVSPMEFCRVPRETWDVINVNDRVEVQGKRSVLGFQVKKFERQIER